MADSYLLSPVAIPQCFTARYGEVLSPEEAMRLAVHVAEYARGFSTPNPPVGAAVLDTEGYLVGLGITQPPGGPHAEIMALQAAGEKAHGSTVCVTLEPCNTQGRTGPCSHALLEAGVAKLYYGMSDNTTAQGGGEFLRSQGLTVAQLEEPAHSSIGLVAWQHRISNGLPYVTAKLAATCDGFSAAADGTSQWITGGDARNDAHVERSRVDAILVGTGTFHTDNPSLTARTSEGELYPRQPQRIIIGQSPIPGEIPCEERGATCYRVEAGYNCSPAIHLRTRSWMIVMDYLRRQQFNHVLVEGGPRLVGDAIAQDIADRIVCYMAPMFLGQGMAAAESSQIVTLSQAQRYRIVGYAQVGEDLKLELGRK